MAFGRSIQRNRVPSRRLRSGVPGPLGGTIAVPSLFVIQGRDQGNRFELPLSEVAITLGRDLSCTIQLHDTEVSRQHAELRYVGQTLVLLDKGSSNGTFVNNRRIERHELAAGDQVQLGRTVMLYTGGQDPSPRRDEDIQIVTHRRDSERSRIVRTMRQDEGSQLLSSDFDQTQSNWLARARGNLQVMYRTALAVSHTLDIDQLLGRIMDLIFEWVDADRGCFLLLDPESQTFKPRVRRDRRAENRSRDAHDAPAPELHQAPSDNPSLLPASLADTDSLPPSVSQSSPASSSQNADRLTISQTILDYVLEHKEGVLTSDAREDERWDPAASIVQQGVREAICVPMQGRYDIVGVIYIDTLTPAARHLFRDGKKFSDDHLKLMVAIGHQAALAIEDTNYYSAMVQAERLAAVGQTIATLSHHIKNILQGIRGGSYLIEMGLNDHDESIVRKGWDIVEKNQKRISNLVLDMLTFSKEREPDLAPAELNQTIADVVELMAARAAEKSVSLRFEPAPDLPTLVFDAEGIHRAALNIVTNAIDASADNVSAGRTPGEVVVSTSLSLEGAASIVVQDNGAGIAPEDLGEIFSLFVSRKGARGTGLGLPVSQKILKEHGGQIKVESELGRGSRFILEFPAQLPAPQASTISDTSLAEAEAAARRLALGETT